MANNAETSVVSFCVDFGGSESGRNLLEWQLVNLIVLGGDSNIWVHVKLKITVSNRSMQKTNLVCPHSMALRTSVPLYTVCTGRQDFT